MKTLLNTTNNEPKFEEEFSIGDIILSENYGMDRTNKHNDTNVIVLGPAGSGKNRCVLFPNILNQKESYVIVDPGGEMLNKTGAYMQKRGYRVRVVDFSGKNQYNTYNPLNYCKTKIDIINLAKNINKGSIDKGKFQDPFWADSEAALLEAIIGLLVCKPEGSKVPYCKMPEIMGKTLYPSALPSIKDILQLVNMPWDSDCGMPLPKSLEQYKAEEDVEINDEVHKKYVAKVYYEHVILPHYFNQLEVIFENIREYNEENIREYNESERNDLPFSLYPLKCWESFKLAPEKTAMSVIISVAVIVDVFTVSGIKEMLSSDNLDLDTFGDGNSDGGYIKKDALYIVTPIGNSVYNCLVQILIHQLMNIKMTRQADCGFKENHHITFYYNEIVNVGIPVDFLQYLAVMRKSRIEMFTFFQELDQVKCLFGDDWHTFMGLSSVIMSLGCIDKVTEKYLLEMAGTTTTTTTTELGSKRRVSILSPFYRSKNKSHTEWIERPIIQQNGLRFTNGDDCVIFKRGLNAILDKKYWAEKHPDIIKCGNTFKKDGFDSSLIYGVEPKKA